MLFRSYTCSANCPQDVDFSDIIFALRDMAVKEGYAPPDLLEKIDKITTAANEFRRDSIYAILREGDISMDKRYG